MLFKLIESCKWKKVRNLLNSSNAYEMTLELDSSDLNCLAFAVGHSAPIDIIQQIIRINPSLGTSRDVFGATALHVATLNGASIDIIKLLMEHYPSLVHELDFDRRSSLHHAVEYACQSGDHNYSYLDVIQLLSLEAPQMILTRDTDGDTPIDLVQVVKIDLVEKSKEYARLHSVYTLLRQTSISVYKDNKTKWELEGYSEKVDFEADKQTQTTSSLCS